jgi:hypothetical protein
MKKRPIARRFMKNERGANTLQATAPVHEVYLRLVDVTKIQWRERAQFLAMAAQMTPRILVTAARARGAQKRGGGSPKVKTPFRPPRRTGQFCQWTRFYRVLAVGLHQAEVGELRYFGGLKEEEVP